MLTGCVALSPEAPAPVPPAPPGGTAPPVEAPPAPPPAALAPAPDQLERLVAYADAAIRLSAEELESERELLRASVAASAAPSTQDVHLALLLASGESRDDPGALRQLDRFLASPAGADDDVLRFVRVLRRVIAARAETGAALARAHASLASEREARARLERQIEALKAIERSLPRRATE